MDLELKIHPYDVVDITSLISESVVLDDNWLREAANDNKKNLFQKVWGILKKIFRIIKVKCSEIMHAFLSIFRTKKVDDKTLDQIAAHVLGETEDIPGSKHLQFRYENNRRIKINYVADTVKKLVKEPEIIGHAKDDRPEQNAIMLIFHVVKRPYILDPIIEMVESIKDNNGKITFEKEKMKDAIDSVWAGLIFGRGITISLEEWTVLNDKIIRLNKAMEVVDDDSLGTVTINDESNSLSADWAKSLNGLVTITALLQKGINCIGDGMRQIYQLDEKYHDRINSKNFTQLLPKFVKACVEYNIPSKYIHFAIRQICDKSINADLHNPEEKAKISGLKGNGRFVMFPNDPSLQDKVIKIGYNGLGVRGNRNEFVVFDKVKNIPDIASNIYNIYDAGDPDQYIILADRVEPIDHYEHTEEWNKRMKQLCIDNNVGFIIRCNDGGFGKVNGQVVCCDYGNVHRIDR